MGLKESNMIDIGTKAPNFTLPDTVSDRFITLEDGQDYKGTVILFICNHCPYVLHINEQLTKLGFDFMAKGIRVIAISSNDVVNFPQDSPEKMKLVAEKEGYPFPYLYDESQEVAKAYHAACTPDIYLFDDELKLYYRGRLDASRPGNAIPVDGADLRDAVDQLLNGAAAPEKQYPSAGCSIKWK